jgi:flagellar basal body rod protein FlgF
VKIPGRVNFLTSSNSGADFSLAPGSLRLQSNNLAIARFDGYISLINFDGRYAWYDNTTFFFTHTDLPRVSGSLRE